MEGWWKDRRMDERMMEGWWKNGGKMVEGRMTTPDDDGVRQSGEPVHLLNAYLVYLVVHLWLWE